MQKPRSVQAHFLPLALPRSVISFLECTEQKFIHHEGAQWTQTAAQFQSRSSVSLPEMSHGTFSRGSAELGVDVFKELSVFLPVTRSWVVMVSPELTVWQANRRLFFSRALFCTDWHRNSALTLFSRHWGLWDFFCNSCNWFWFRLAWLIWYH